MNNCITEIDIVMEYATQKDALLHAINSAHKVFIHFLLLWKWIFAIFLVLSFCRRRMCLRHPTKHIFMRVDANKRSYYAYPHTVKWALNLSEAKEPS